jgi:integrase
LEVTANQLQTEVKCPKCSSKRIYKDGLRHMKDGTSIQRWLCRDCYYCFTEKNSPRKNHATQLNTSSVLLSKRQVGELLAEESKNLAETPRQEQAQREGTMLAVDARGKIVEYGFWLLKQGFAKSTIEGRTKLLRRLVNVQADIFEPETVKEAISKQTWSEGRKEYAVEAYTSFLKMTGKTWTPPKYRRIETLPFIPTEAEIDALIAGCGTKMAAFLSTLKETGIRCGEAWNLKWTNIDFVHSTLTVTPEKHSNPRMFKISSKLLAMLSMLPRKSELLFGNGVMRGFAASYLRQRKKLARKLANPRLVRITFHTFRHWKATMEYHRTKDILHVMRLLGHKNIKNTLRYTQLVTFEDDDYVCKTAASVKEATELIEAGFEYVCDMEAVKLFRKRK